MTKNTLGDLNNHLFAQIERLGEENLSDEELEKEIKRADSNSKVSSQIVNNAELVLKAKKFMDDRLDMDSKLPEMLEG